MLSSLGQSCRKPRNPEIQNSSNMQYLLTILVRCLDNLGHICKQYWSYLQTISFVSRQHFKLPKLFAMHIAGILVKNIPEFLQAGFESYLETLEHLGSNVLRGTNGDNLSHQTWKKVDRQIDKIDINNRQINRWIYRQIKIYP